MLAMLRVDMLHKPRPFCRGPARIYIEVAVRSGHVGLYEHDAGAFGACAGLVEDVVV